MNLLLLLLLLVVAVARSEASESTTCEIDCANGSTCQRGPADFSRHPKRADNDQPFPFHEKTEEQGWHCACPEGMTGLLCNVPYAICPDGGHVCYNGGHCIPPLDGLYQYEPLYCDCPTQIDQDGNLKSYSGKYCEVEVVASGNRCDHDQNPCLNGGTCSKHVHELELCHCPLLYVGRVCEYYAPSMPACSLQCQHGGVCRYGTKGDNANLLWNANQTKHVVHESHMYCECPLDHSGLYCQQKHGSQPTATISTTKAPQPDTHHRDDDCTRDINTNGAISPCLTSTSSAMNSSSQAKLGRLGGTKTGIPLIVLVCVGGLGVAYFLYRKRAHRTRSSTDSKLKSTAIPQEDTGRLLNNSSSPRLCTFAVDDCNGLEEGFVEVTLNEDD